jgi:hypothetical protein
MPGKHIVKEETDSTFIEIASSYAELILEGKCMSFECQSFRENQCRMHEFLGELEDKDFRVGLLWNTPTHFFAHLLKHNDVPCEKFLNMLDDFKCFYLDVAESIHKNCDFTKNMLEIQKLTVANLCKKI